MDTLSAYTPAWGPTASDFRMDSHLARPDERDSQQVCAQAKVRQERMVESRLIRSYAYVQIHTQKRRMTIRLGLYGRYLEPIRLVFGIRCPYWVHTDYIRAHTVVCTGSARPRGINPDAHFCIL